MTRSPAHEMTIHVTLKESVCWIRHYHHIQRLPICPTAHPTLTPTNHCRISKHASLTRESYKPIYPWFSSWSPARRLCKLKPFLFYIYTCVLWENVSFQVIAICKLKQTDLRFVTICAQAIAKMALVWLSKFLSPLNWRKCAFCDFFLVQSYYYMIHWSIHIN